jgi:hypothetical protein
MRDCIVFDIETAADERLWTDDSFRKEVFEGIKPDGRLRDSTKIAADIEARFEAVEEKAPLSWCHGKIRAIGWGLLGGEEPPKAFASEDEAEVIEAFVSDLLQFPGRPLIGGFNCREFDVPFLAMRAAVHNIELPYWWPNKFDWNAIIDPVDIFGRNGRLKDYLRALGLPGKTADGADAPNMPLDELLDYVRNDVHVETLLIERLVDRFAALHRHEETVQF